VVIVVCQYAKSYSSNADLKTRKSARTNCTGELGVIGWRPVNQPSVDGI